jgi:hypothetical protein
MCGVDGIDGVVARGFAFLDDVAGTAVSSAGVGELLGEVCAAPFDWACVLAALACWDGANRHIDEATNAITEAAKDYCAEWIKTHN